LEQEAGGAAGRGLNIENGAVVEADGLVVSRNQEVGIFIAKRSSSLRVSNLVVRDTANDAYVPDEVGRGGRGLELQAGATVELSNALFERNEEVAVLAHQSGTKLQMSDVVIRDTGSDNLAVTDGRGLVLMDGAEGVASRVVVERSGGVSILALGSDTPLRLTDILVRVYESRGPFVWGNFSLAAGEGASVEVERALLGGAGWVGVFAFGQQTTILSSDVIIRDTIPFACGDESDCPAMGDGALASDGANIELRGFEVSRNARCGITIWDASMNLHDGVVSDNVIGVCLHTSDFDSARLNDNVVYRNNRTRLDPNFDLSVPDPSALFQ